MEKTPSSNVLDANQQLIKIVVAQRNVAITKVANLEARLSVALEEIERYKNEKMAEDLFSNMSEKDKNSG
tara:strand:- start:19 stop:228 length:210 start_codon:yes stop_codon:yes gene_type:complete